MSRDTATVNRDCRGRSHTPEAGISAGNWNLKVPGVMAGPRPAARPVCGQGVRQCRARPGAPTRAVLEAQPPCKELGPGDTRRVPWTRDLRSPASRTPPSAAGPPEAEPLTRGLSGSVPPRPGGKGHGSRLDASRGGWGRRRSHRAGPGACVPSERRLQVGTRCRPWPCSRSALRLLPLPSRTSPLGLAAPRRAPGPWRPRTLGRLPPACPRDPGLFWFGMRDAHEDPRGGVQMRPTAQDTRASPTSTRLVPNGRPGASADVSALPVQCR